MPAMCHFGANKIHRKRLIIKKIGWLAFIPDRMSEKSIHINIL